MFLFASSWSGIKTELFIFKRLYQNEIKTFQIPPEFLKTKQNF
jgi:hypothetical protein